MKTLTDNHHVGYQGFFSILYLNLINIIALLENSFISISHRLISVSRLVSFSEDPIAAKGLTKFGITYSRRANLCPAFLRSARYYSSSTREVAKLDPYFVTGLTEAEGSFSVIKGRDARAKFGMNILLRFKITMLVNEIGLLNKVQAFFGVGTVNIDDKRGTVDFIVRDKIGLGVIKEHFLKYPLRGTKFLDMVDFVRALDLMEENLHRTEEGLNLIVKLAEGMNYLRTDYSQFPPIHTIKDNPQFIPINGHFINGFIAGDGCLFLKTKSNFGSMGIQISQHHLNRSLLQEILYYFNPDSKVFTHGKGTKSVQITLGGKSI